MLLLLQMSSLNLRLLSRTPLHCAAGNGHPEVVGRLLGAEATVDAADEVNPPCLLVAGGTSRRLLLLLGNHLGAD
jgi:hypothetical protein